jgi:hypothetical protein
MARLSEYRSPDGGSFKTPYVNRRPSVFRAPRRQAGQGSEQQTARQVARHPPSASGTFEIDAKGKAVTLGVNGAPTAEWKSCEVPKGYLGLEAEGHTIEFRNVKQKETK